MKKLFCLLALIYFSAQLFAAKVEFVYKPKSGEKIEKIAVAGTFNSWNSGRDFLEKKADGTWHREMELENGVYYYKFVINGNNWVFDPRSDSSIKKDDGYGGYNSGVAVGESTGYNLGKPLPNDINLNALNFDDTKPEYFNAIDNELTGIGIRTLAGDVQEVNVSVNNSARIRLEKSKTTLGFDYYSKVIELPMPVKDGEKISLSFQLKDGSKKIAYPSDEKKIEVTFKKTFPVPGWAKGCIWYQIMLERFKNGSEENDPQGTLPWTWDFSKKAETEQGNFYSFVWGRFFGGDLQGLTEKLPYLKDLGITAIYLNPVFKSSSYQKYNTADYRHIDDHLGFILDPAEIKGETEDPATWKWTKTDKLFLEFLQKAHQMGFKVIIDGVFNHSGDDFWAFNDLKEKGQDSAYKNWYIVTDWNVFTKEAKNGRGYSGWAGFGGVPEFRKDQKTGLDAGVKKHILAITKRWMDPNGDSDPSDGIDGWRLDVPDCVPQTFWVDWCGLVKSINPDAYITGELWVEATDWLTPKLFHAQMNYPLAKLLIKFIADESLSPSKFDKALKELFATYPGQVNSVQMNLLDSHDTDRLVSMLYNPGRPFDKRNRLNPSDSGDYNPDYKTGKPDKETYELLKLITAVQFTLPGSPMIWYGDEAGMWGSDDPFDRKPMIWREQQPYDDKDSTFMDDIYNHYRTLARIKTSYPQLKEGSFSNVLVDDKNKVYAFSMTRKNKIAIVAVNNSNKSAGATITAPLADNTELTEMLSENKIYKVRNGSIKLTLPPKTAKILVQK